MRTSHCRLAETAPEVHVAPVDPADFDTYVGLLTAAADQVGKTDTVDVVSNDNALDLRGIATTDLLDGLNRVQQRVQGAVDRVEEVAVVSDSGGVELPEFLWRRWEDAQRQLDRIAMLRDTLTLARTA